MRSLRVQCPSLCPGADASLGFLPPQFLMTTNSLSTCCESGGRTLADSGPAASAQAPVYCPVYESRLLATARHELNSAAALGVYGSPYGSSQGYSNYVTYGSEASAFYSLVRGQMPSHHPAPRPAPPFGFAKCTSVPGTSALDTLQVGVGGKKGRQLLPPVPNPAFVQTQRGQLESPSV